MPIAHSRTASISQSGARAPTNGVWKTLSAIMGEGNEICVERGVEMWWKWGRIVLMVGLLLFSIVASLQDNSRFFKGS